MDGNGIGNGQYVRYIAADDGLSAVPGRPSLGAGPTDARRWIPPPPGHAGATHSHVCMQTVHADTWGLRAITAITRTHHSAERRACNEPPSRGLGAGNGQCVYRHDLCGPHAINGKTPKQTDGGKEKKKKEKKRACPRLAACSQPANSASGQRSSRARPPAARRPPSARTGRSRNITPMLLRSKECSCAGKEATHWPVRFGSGLQTGVRTRRPKYLHTRIYKETAAESDEWMGPACSRLAAAAAAARRLLSIRVHECVCFFFPQESGLGD